MANMKDQQQQGMQNQANRGQMDTQNSQNRTGNRADVNTETNAASPGVDSHRTAGTRNINESQDVERAGQGLNRNLDQDQDISSRSQETVRSQPTRTGAGETSRSSSSGDLASDDDIKGNV